MACGLNAQDFKMKFYWIILNKSLFICRMSLGQFPETLNVVFIVFTSLACFSGRRFVGPLMLPF